MDAADEKDLARISQSGRLAIGKIPKKILIADDNETDQQYIAIKLNNLHAEVNFAGNLESAYQVVREMGPSVILLDINIPYNHEGPNATIDQLLEFVRYHSEKFCIVMLTGHVDETHIDRFYGAGVMDFIGKDRIAVELELLSRIKGAHELHGLFREKSYTATILIQMAIMRSQMDRMIAMQKVAREEHSLSRDKDKDRQYKQAFEAGVESGIKKEQKRGRLRRAAAWGSIVAFAWACRETIAAFIKGMISRH